MSGITVFNIKKINTGILGWNYRMIDDVMQDYVIVKMIKLEHCFLKKRWSERWPEYLRILPEYVLYGMGQSFWLCSALS